MYRKENYSHGLDNKKRICVLASLDVFCQITSVLRQCLLPQNIKKINWLNSILSSPHWLVPSLSGGGGLFSLAVLSSWVWPSRRLWWPTDGAVLQRWVRLLGGSCGDSCWLCARYPGSSGVGCGVRYGPWCLRAYGMGWCGAFLCVRWLSWCCRCRPHNWRTLGPPALWRVQRNQCDFLGSWDFNY